MPSWEDVMGTWATWAAASIVVAAGSLPPAAADAADITVLTNQGAVPGVRALAEGFASASGHKVTVLEETGSALEQRITSGPADLITLSPEAMPDLAKKGRVVADTVTPFTLAGLGVSVRAGAAKPNISTVENYRATLLAAKSIGYSRGCSGQNVAKGIEELGLTEALKSKIVLTGGGTGPVTFFLARGDFELGIQQTNIMVGAAGTDYVGPVPGTLNKPCPNSVALLPVSKEQAAARAMIAFMVSPAAAPLLRKVHEEPPGR
jgi:molybdate transport system substrate-binding protein